MTCRLSAITMAATLALSAPGRAATGPGPEDVVALEHWVDAVQQHVPGRVDEPLRSVAVLTYDDRHRLLDAQAVFFRALLGKSVPTSDASEARAARLGADRARVPGANAWLERAAILHGDAVIFASRLPQPPTDPRDDGDEGRLITASDGEYLGVAQPVWHSKFARDLLDRVQPRPAADAFVARWYHAMVAFFMGEGRYGEAAPLLRRAASLAPDDARLLFDRACLAEALGLPRSQQVLLNPRAEDVEPSPPGAPPGRPGTPARGTRVTRAAPVSERATNNEAERLFRRALAVDGSMAEARVRIGRLLILRTRYDEADRELTRALATTRDPAVAYLAHLFASRADARLGRDTAAADHAQAALDLFPDAQSALIASSLLALRRADVAGALAPIDRLARLADARPPRDPWSEYHMGAGRDAVAWLTSLWASVPRSATAPR